MPKKEVRKINLFKKAQKRSFEKSLKQYFSYIEGYTPCYSNFNGGLYEMEITRACIHSFATNVSKFRAEVTGRNNDRLKKILRERPNPLQTPSQFLQRIATMYMAENTAFIVPLYDEYGVLNGFYPLSTSKCQVIKQGNKNYLKYCIENGKYEAIEFEKVGRLIQHQYSKEIFGESNSVLNPTMQIINAQNQAIVESAKNNAVIRFIGKLASVLDDKDIKEEQDRLKRDSLNGNNSGGVLLFDQKYEELKAIDSKPYIVSNSQREIIKENVFSYFHTNEAILTNNFTESQFNAYYEGLLEPFIIQLGEVLSKMAFTERERGFGNEIMFSSNRLQYSTLTDKVAYATQMFDRGMFTQNMGFDLFQLPRSDDPNANKFYIRKEYMLVEDTEKEGEENAKTEKQGIQTVVNELGSQAE